MPRNDRRRARVAFSDSAAKQLEEIASEAALHALDRALVALSVDPELGDPLPSTADRVPLREYTDPVEPVRLLYFVTALHTVVVVAYIEA
ncbi:MULTISPECIES: type II toxin-antitoxin system RelE/ParE family toxin [unclassified Streptomyces]|uniref:type II toxin-antitoxin system RelE/ParE family toxin n=1 Tax=unclassified Streptomyces TaxID=2593676 RepID=UPI002E0D193E|nr:MULTISPECIES: type II toxin-antitoxin system RelE/ParE family toxin [unclassified Streptomyces]WSR23073.1 type II toxin-antitoxin system RelE/ParE family toxin [Streptomyces sp. NBC_01205]